MSHAIEFIETSLFTQQIQTIATDSELKDLQSELIDSTVRCSMSIFNELKASLEEAVAIKNGSVLPSRVTRYDVADVKAIREKLNVSQAEMARALGTSLDTIKSWEQKRRNPTGLAAKVLATIQDDPEFFNALAAH